MTPGCCLLTCHYDQSEKNMADISNRSSVDDEAHRGSANLACLLELGSRSTYYGDAFLRALDFLTRTSYDAASDSDLDLPAELVSCSVIGFKETYYL